MAKYIRKSRLKQGEFNLRARANIYTWIDPETKRTLWYSITDQIDPQVAQDHPEATMQRITVFLPPKYDVEEGKDGKPVITFNNEAVAEDFDNTYVGVKPIIRWTRPKDGKEVKDYAEPLRPELTMKIIAYRHGADMKHWSIHPKENSIRTAIYLPPCCKLYKAGAASIGSYYIVPPDSEKWESVTFKDGRKAKVPHLAQEDIIWDIGGHGKDMTPYIVYGSKYRHCFVAMPDDIYEPDFEDTKPVVNRIGDEEWESETLSYDENTQTSYWVKTVSKTEPTDRDLKPVKIVREPLPPLNPAEASYKKSEAAQED